MSLFESSEHSVDNDKDN